MEDIQPKIGNNSGNSEPAMTMAQLLEESHEIKSVRRGETMMGTIVSITPHEILVDIGSKSEGIVAGRELESLSPEDLAELHPGDEVPVFIVRPEDEEGHILLSLTRAQAEKDWLTAQKMFEFGRKLRRGGHRPQQGWPDRQLRAGAGLRTRVAVRRAAGERAVPARTIAGTT